MWGLKPGVQGKERRKFRPHGHDQRFSKYGTQTANIIWKLTKNAKKSLALPRSLNQKIWGGAQRPMCIQLAR